jgi:succinate dehydrogenase / fumarate reductase cytochrome b subunit
LTARQRAFRSTIALKAIMAISGLLMILFLIAHMYGNLMAFGGRDTFDGYTNHLFTLGQPILPHSGFMWGLRVVMGAAVVIHILSAAALSARDWRARGGVGKRYKSSKGRRGVQRTYSSFTLRWGGVVIALYVVFHVLNLTTGTIAPGGGSADPYQRLLNSFGVWWVVAVYTIAVLAVAFHVRHGTWSALTQLGAHVSAKARLRLKVLAYAVTVVIAVGFLVVPWCIVAGVIG